MAKSMTQPAPLHGVLLKVFQQGAANTGNGKINFVFIHFYYQQIIQMMMVDDHDEDVELLTSPVNHTLGGASGAAAVHDEEGVRERHLDGQDDDGDDDGEDDGDVE